MLGSVNAYTEATGHPDAHAKFMNFEWFLQDNWRVKKNLTIDAGIRFYYVGPTESRGDQLAVFQPGPVQSGAGAGADSADHSSAASAAASTRSPARSCRR